MKSRLLTNASRLQQGLTSTLKVKRTSRHRLSMLSLHVISLKKYLHVHLWMYLCMFLGIYIYGVALLIGSILSTVKSALLIHGARKVFPIFLTTTSFHILWSSAVSQDFPICGNRDHCDIDHWHENCWHHLLISRRTWATWRCGSPWLRSACFSISCT